MLENKTLQVNFNAVTVMLRVLNQVYEIAYEDGYAMLNGEVRNSKHYMKNFYASVARLYGLDFCIWIVMFQSK